MTGKVVTVALYSRGVNTPRSFHWGFLLWPEGSDGSTSGEVCDVYHATDRTYLDMTTFRMVNPGGNWRFDKRHNVDPEKSSMFIGCIAIGAIPNGVSRGDLDAFFAATPLPIKHQDPQQSCRTWVWSAIRALQEKGWAWAFDVKAFEDWAFDYGEKTDEHGGSRMVDYEHAQK